MADVNYVRINFEDNPSTNTPLNQANLNKMDKGIADCAAAINASNQDVSGLKNNLKANNQDFVFDYDNGKYGYRINNTFVPFKNPTGTKSINANGTYDVTDYASVVVNVPGSTFEIITNPLGWAEGLFSNDLNVVKYNNTKGEGRTVTVNGKSCSSGSSASSSYCTFSAVNTSSQGYRGYWIATLKQKAYVNGTLYNSGSTFTVPEGSNGIIVTPYS